MTKAQYDALARREKECLRLLPRLYTSKGIAAELKIRPDSVDRYIASAKVKLGTSSRHIAAEMLLAHEARCAPKIPISGFLGVGDCPSPEADMSEPGASAAGALHEERAEYMAGKKPSLWRLLRSASWRDEKNRVDLPLIRRLFLVGLYALIMVAGFAIFSVALLVLMAVNRELHMH